METQSTDLARRQTANLTDKSADNAMTAAPPVDIYENVDEILLIADFPGVPNEALTVRLEGPELLIEGTQTQASSAAARVLRFSRAFRVPDTVDPNGIRAELSQGVLRVHLAKSEAAKPRRIEVRTS
jgi:HSP20 family molecular chaperone IbpA